MNNFPLYDNLSKDLKNRDLLVKEKTDFVNKIKQIDQDGLDLIYALIRVYYVKNEENKTDFSLPYNGKYIKEDMKFDLDDFPIQLKQMIFKFIKIHIVKMEEENALNKDRY